MLRFGVVAFVDKVQMTEASYALADNPWEFTLGTMIQRSIETYFTDYEAKHGTPDNPKLTLYVRCDLGADWLAEFGKFERFHISWPNGGSKFVVEVDRPVA